MNIALVIVIIIIIFLIFTQCEKQNDKENFYSSHSYYRRRPRYTNHSYSYGSEWYNYPYFWNYWGNPWGYMPCVNDVFGQTRCY